MPQAHALDDFAEAGAQSRNIDQPYGVAREAFAAGHGRRHQNVGANWAADNMTSGMLRMLRTSSS